MITGWLSKAGRFTVEHVACPDYAGAVDVSAPPTGVLHTTEGSLESALAVFRVHYAPHFLAGCDAAGRPRILQLLPLGHAAAALEHPAGTPATNGIARVQIEVATFSKTAPWYPDTATADVVAALLFTLDKLNVVSLKRVYPDTMPDGVWASPAFERRHDGHFGRDPGWYGHIEVPNNAHWDPGALKWSQLLDASRGHSIAAPTPKVRRFHKPLILQPRTYTLVRQASGDVFAEQIDRPH